MQGDVVLEVDAVEFASLPPGDVDFGTVLEEIADDFRTEGAGSAGDQTGAIGEGHAEGSGRGIDGDGLGIRRR